MRYKRSCAVRSCDAFEAVKLNSNLTREGKSICRSDSRYHNDSFDHHVLNCVTWRDFVLIKSTTAIFLPATPALPHTLSRQFYSRSDNERRRADSRSAQDLGPYGTRRWCVFRPVTLRF